MILADLLELCPHCGMKKKGRIESSGPHVKLSCNTCDRYIKMLRKDEAEKYGVEAFRSMSPGAVVYYDKKETPTDRIEELHFKLDLLLAHLGVRE